MYSIISCDYILPPEQPQFFKATIQQGNADLTVSRGSC